MDEIHIVPYNPSWPILFKEESARLWTPLRDSIVRIEHFGSTAVHGLAAKPVIDLLIVMRSLEAAEQSVPILESLGYDYWAEDPAQRSIPGRLFFKKGM